MRIVELVRILFWFCVYRLSPGFKSRQALEIWQKRRLQKLIHKIRDQSPFYSQRLVESGGWEKLPLMDKKQMMDHFDELNTEGLSRDHAVELAIQSEKSRDFSPMIRNITVGLSSGTSGSRGLFCANPTERAQYAGAILAKALPQHFWQRRQRVALFLRANNNLYTAAKGFFLQFRFFDMLNAIESHTHDLNQYQPTLLIAPPSVLLRLAEQVEKGHLQLNKVWRIFSVAEVLEPQDRARLEKAFGILLDQIYQCTEGFLGITCSQGRMHLNEDLVLIEKEWIDRSHRKFYPIVTDLNRTTQPVLRYRLNDILTASLDSCSCGSVFTTLDMIEGRSDDMLQFRKSDHTPVAVFPDFVRNHILYASDTLEDYAVIQKADDTLVVSLKGNNLEQLESQVRIELQKLAQRLGAELPHLVFDHKFQPTGLNKLRRIRRESAVHQ